MSRVKHRRDTARGGSPSHCPPADKLDGDESGARSFDASEPDPLAAEPSSIRRDRRVRGVIEWVAVLGGAVVVALLVRTFLFTTFWIPSGSMEPTLMGQERRDRVVVNRLSYKFHDVNRGDIIVFDLPPGQSVDDVDGQEVNELIKRVIGLSGETVELRDGHVYIDRVRLEEPYLPDGTKTTPMCGEGSRFTVPEDSVFVMGDNRAGSRDARCWATHSVPESTIVGRAFIRVWPLTEITFF